MAKQRVPRTRNLGTQTEAAFWGALRSALRRHYKWWKPMRECKRRARVGKGRYLCSGCHGIFPSDEVEIDHIVPCGSLRSYEDIAGFIERMTPEDPAAFQLLCKGCHKKKTLAERERRK